MGLWALFRGVGDDAERIAVDTVFSAGITGGVEGEVKGGHHQGVSSSEKVEEAIQALTMLGFAPAPSKKIVANILAENPNLATEEIIKQALKTL